MTRNEEKARTILTFAMQTSVSIELAKCVYAEKLNTDLSNTVHPVLTHSECLSVTKNYPFKFKEIKHAFL